jgi:hypothetical protein
MIAILSGMRIFGDAHLVARPCRTGSYCKCDCCGLDAIPLGDPKPTVTEVNIDGAVVPADEYELHWGLNGWSLVRVGDGANAPPGWPSHQKRYLADTETNTFSVYLTVGLPIDLPMIRAAVIELVCDIATDVAGGYKNANELEQGVIQATIGNATVQVDFDRLDRMKRGEMGPATSKLLAVYAPGERTTQSVVYAPELHECWTLILAVAPVVAS